MDRARRVPQRQWITIGVLAGLIGYLSSLFAAPWLFGIPEPGGQPASADAVLAARHNARLLVVSVGGAMVVTAGLLYTARNYRLAHRGQAVDRFTKALERLGSDHLYVRIGGVHALRQLMHDSPEHHADTVDVLVAFIRDRARRARTAQRSGIYPQPPMPTEPDADVQHALTALVHRPAGRPERGRLNLRDLHLAGAQLRGARLQRAYLGGAQLCGADLGGAQLQGADLGGAHLQGADLTMAKLQNADLCRAQLQDAYLTKAELQDADLTMAKLQSAHLGGAQLHGADLGGAQLQDARLGGAQLQDAYLGGAQLQDADLGGAQLQDAYLGGAQLQKADLGEAQLQDADLDGADLTGVWGWEQAQLDQARITAETVLPTGAMSPRTRGKVDAPPDPTAPEQDESHNLEAASRRRNVNDEDDQ